MADLVITAANVARGSNALVEYGTTAVAVTAGQAVFSDPTTGTFKLSSNNGVGTRDVYGIALHAAAAGQPLAVQRGGDITLGATLVAGTDYWLSATLGGTCPRADLGVGKDPVLIGIAKSTSVLTLNITDVGVTL